METKFDDLLHIVTDVGHVGGSLGAKACSEKVFASEIPFDRRFPVVGRQCGTAIAEKSDTMVKPTDRMERNWLAKRWSSMNQTGYVSLIRGVIHGRGTEKSL